MNGDKLPADDPFTLWESYFSGVEMPKDPLDTIIEESLDPIACAQALHRFVSEQHEEARPHTMRHGVNKLSRKYNGPYKESRDLEVLINGGYALPGPSPSPRRHDAMTAIALNGHFYLRGTFHGIAQHEYVEKNTGGKQLMITLYVSEPVSLDERGNPDTELLLPNYALAPITSVVKYAFLRNRHETGE